MKLDDLIEIASSNHRISLVEVETAALELHGLAIGVYAILTPGNLIPDKWRSKRWNQRKEIGDQ